MTIRLTQHLPSVPPELAEAISDTYRATMDHFLKLEWDDAQVDAGRLCEAALRFLEWKMTESFTPIDGKSKPNRSTVVGKAKNDASLEPSLRAQVPQAIELMMDFRNNRNSAHLGSIDANKLDASCVIQLATWVVAEILRIETSRPTAEVQQVLDRLAERHVPVVQTVNGRPIVLLPDMSAADKAIVLLYQQGEPVLVRTLRDWAEYGNATRWRDTVIKDLLKRKLVHVEKDGMVTLLRPGETAAQKLIMDAGGL